MLTGQGFRGPDRSKRWALASEVRRYWNAAEAVIAKCLSIALEFL